MINGVQQFVSIRAEVKDVPLYLYLHGGPRDAAFPLVMKYNKDIEKHFIKTLYSWQVIHREVSWDFFYNS